MADTDTIIIKAIEKAMPRDIDIIDYIDEFGYHSQIVVAKGVNDYFDLSLDLEEKLVKKSTEIVLDLTTLFETELIRRCGKSDSIMTSSQHIIAYVEPTELALSATGLDKYLKHMGFPARDTSEAPTFERHSYP